MNKKFLTGIMSGIFFVCLSGMVNATPIQWSSSVGGNDHWYDIVSFSGSWDAANADALSRTYLGMQGHLATLISEAENQFVLDNRHRQMAWLGGYQLNSNNEPAGNWAWVTGETWSYTNWRAGEPNDTTGAEQYLQFHNWPDGTWNDQGWQAFDYIIEFESITSVPEPATMLLLGTGLVGVAGAARRKKKNKA